jgi:hypothetical protein
MDELITSINITVELAAVTENQPGYWQINIKNRPPYLVLAEIPIQLQDFDCIPITGGILCTGRTCSSFSSSGRKWTRTIDLFCVREIQKVSIVSIPYILGHKSTHSDYVKVNLSIESIISMLWYPVCTRVAPRMMKER